MARNLKRGEGQGTGSKAVVVEPLSEVVRKRALSKGLRVRIKAAPDKSMTHRAIMFSSLATGSSVIDRPLLGEDCLATMEAFQALGVEAVVQDSAKGGRITVKSGGVGGFKSPLLPLDFANSGTSARLLTGIFSAVPGLFVTCFGDRSLSQRPMGRVVKLLRPLGALIEGRSGGEFLPLAISGRSLRGAQLSSDKASAQIKSAVLLAGALAQGETGISLPSGGRDHTERFLRHMGAQITSERDGTNEQIVIRGGVDFKPLKMEVPVDPSSVAFFAVYAALIPGSRFEFTDVLWNVTRTGFVTVLSRMGVSIKEDRVVSSGIEPTARLMVEGQEELKGIDTIDLNPATFIDEIPVLAVAAAFAKEETRFRNLHELRVKESDRLQTTAGLLKRGGAKVRIDGDDLVIGGGLRKVKAFTFNPSGDHRLAMAASIMAKMADGPCKIEDPACVRVSFPDFFDRLVDVEA